MQHLVASCMRVLKHFVEDFVEDDKPILPTPFLYKIMLFYTECSNVMHSVLLNVNSVFPDLHNLNGQSNVFANHV